MIATHKGPVAIVTGGRQGIGQAVTDRLTRDGATVEVFDIRSEATVDVADPKAVATAVSGVIRRYGRIDILVNNAGIFPHVAFDELDLACWRQVLATNLESVFLCSKAVYPWMKQRRYGRIINISSAAFLVGDFDLTHYAASKGGVIGFTRSLAKGAGRDGITVNSVAPGFIETPGVLASPEEMALFDDIVSEQSIPRRGKPEDIAACVSYLASPEASFITGQLINIDGGHRFT
ncbi:SDR family oxidoreductase [Nocardia abscessus]|uniref:SDR family oxidoreductase n=1 Tax=Nocardia TaxID=1817 RepID=UPI001893DA51|nr:MULTISPECIES: SDR family NAD(P)-dependent oxidoreductase [Nocardia]MBF6222482.1 SDR family oxidoreductase [Nocardia abscessus]